MEILGNSKTVNGELYTCTNGGTEKHVYTVKSARKKDIGQAGKMYGEMKKKHMFLTHIYMCVCIYIYTPYKISEQDVW